ncbi:MAG: hypothetical protein FWG99_00925 [Treponema sp.]|nr:hypothetical protein [Treponema sp.]
MSYEKCREILLKETELIQNATDLQKKMQDAVSKREWTDFEGHFSSISAMESEILALEKEREGLFHDFNTGDGKKKTNRMPDPKGQFYAMTALLPAEQRNDLTDIYRSLKLKALKMRLTNDAFMHHLINIRESLSEFFKLVFPDRSGKMYTSDGTHLSHDMRSIVLNKRF